MSVSHELEFTHEFVEATAGRTSARTLLMLHGTGGYESSLLDLGRSLDPHAALLSPRGKVTEDGMPRFFRRLTENISDECDLVKRAGTVCFENAGHALISGDMECARQWLTKQTLREPKS